MRLSASYSIDEGKTVKLDSVSAAYGYKSRGELLRGWLVFKLCSYTFLVNRLTTVIEAESKVETVLEGSVDVCSFSYWLCYATFSADDCSRTLCAPLCMVTSLLERIKLS